MKKVALVIGTSRNEGTTWTVLRAANEHVALPVFDLAKMSISYFDYESKNLDDDFIPLVEKLVTYDAIGLVSPVYWYSVSAQMKTFIDRLSDLLGPRKDLGRRLRGKELFLFTTGHTENTLPRCMEEPIQLTASYLGMKYVGAHYSQIADNQAVGLETVQSAREFLEARCGGD